MASGQDKLKAGAKPNVPSAAANLANLLPTGTVLAYQALVPSLSNNGTYLAVHKYLAVVAIACCSIVCFLSSFTDSYYSKGKLYYGIATINGLYIFNRNDNEDEDDKADKDIEEGDRGIEKKKAFLEPCFFPLQEEGLDLLIMWALVPAQAQAQKRRKFHTPQALEG